MSSSQRPPKKEKKVSFSDRTSLIYPILGMLVLTALASIISVFFINYFPVHEDIHQRLDKEFLKLHQSAKNILEEETLALPRLAHVLQENHLLRKMMQNATKEPDQTSQKLHRYFATLFPNLGLNRIWLANAKGKIIFQAQQHHHTHLPNTLRGLKKALKGEWELSSLPHINGIALQTTTPLYINKEIVGVIGIAIDVGQRLKQRLKHPALLNVAFGLQNGQQVQYPANKTVQELLAITPEQIQRTFKDSHYFMQENHKKQQAIYFSKLKISDNDVGFIAHFYLDSHTPLFKIGARLSWSAVIILLLVALLGIANYVLLIFPLRRLHRKAMVLMEVCAVDGIDVGHLNETCHVVDRGNEIKLLDRALEAASFIVYAHIGKLHEQKETYQNMATKDALTGLNNRRVLNSTLKKMLHKFRRHNDKQLAILYLDLDNFKPINDTLGHDVGDLLLKEVAQRFHQCLRDSDSIFRIGGDEFVALLPEWNQESAAIQIANRINQEIARPYLLKGQRCTVGVSIGISIFPDHGNTPDTLLKKADSALYQAKAMGRGTCMIYGQDKNTTA
ncbi:diguanylate cyclase domain-containing protein [Magnetococcales bacterium HHB-1]